MAKTAEERRVVARACTKLWQASPAGKASCERSQRAYRARHAAKLNAAGRVYKADPGAKARAIELRALRKSPPKPRAFRHPSHCKHGHEIAGENMAIVGRRRVCRTCKRARDAKYRPGRQASANETVTRWRRKNPERARAISKRSAGRRRGAPGRFTAEEMRAQFTLQQGHCYYCACTLPAAWHAEHKTPIARGGTSWPENMVCSCGDCNRRKGTQTAEEFIARRMAERAP